MEWTTCPRNTSGPFPGGNSGKFGASLNLPIARITKSTSYTCKFLYILSFHFNFSLILRKANHILHVLVRSSSMRQHVPACPCNQNINRQVPKIRQIEKIYLTWVTDSVLHGELPLPGGAKSLATPTPIMPSFHLPISSHGPILDPHHLGVEPDMLDQPERVRVGPDVARDLVLGREVVGDLGWPPEIREPVQLTRRLEPRGLQRRGPHPPRSCSRPRTPPACSPWRGHTCTPAGRLFQRRRSRSSCSSSCCQCSPYLRGEKSSRQETQFSLVCYSAREESKVQLCKCWKWMCWIILEILCSYDMKWVVKNTYVHFCSYVWVFTCWNYMYMTCSKKNRELVKEIVCRWAKGI